MTAHHAPGAVPVSIGRRVGAFAIDAAIAGVIALVLIGITAAAFGGMAAADPSGTGAALASLMSTMVLSLVLIAWWWVVYTGMQAGAGSIGQRALGLRLADAETGEPIGYGRALLRNVVFGLAGSIVVGYFSPLFDPSPRHQGWHDKVGGAVVVDARTAAVPTAAVRGAAPAVPPVPTFPASSAAAQTGAWIPGFAPETPAAAPGPARAAAPEWDAAPASWEPAAPPIAPAPAPQRAPAAYASPTSAPGAMISSVPGVSAGAAAADPFAALVDPSAAVPAAAAPAAAAPIAPTPPVSATFAAPIVEPEDLDATRAAASVPPAAQRAALYADAPVITVLSWDNGSRMAVYGRTLYGRNPAPEPGAVTVTVRDETLSLSKTHFEVGGDSAGAWVMDRHSTNGTVLVRDGMRNALVPGRQTPLRDGDRLECGDRYATVGGSA